MKMVTKPKHLQEREDRKEKIWFEVFGSNNKNARITLKQKGGGVIEED